METIEQLKQENDKLNARLAKAVEVFKEQRAQIETLQKYKDFDSVSRKDYDEVIEENNTLKNKVAELEDSYENLDAEYQAAINCNERNNKELIAADAKIEEYKKTCDIEIKSLQEVNDDLNKQLDKYELKLQAAEEKAEMLQKNLRSVENTTNEEVKKVTVARDEWIEKYRKLEAQYKEQEKFETEVINVKVPQLETRLKEVENDCTNKDKEIESKNLFINQLQKTYDEVFAEYNKLKENSISQAVFDDEVNRLNATISDNVKAYKELLQQKETIEALADEFKKENDEYKVFNNKLISLIETLPQYKTIVSTPVKNQQKTSGSHGTGNNQFMSDEPVVSL